MNKNKDAKSSDNEKVLKFIIGKYKKEQEDCVKYNIPTDDLENSPYILTYTKIVSKALDTIGEEAKLIIYNEFIEPIEDYWYSSFYSRSSYYRRRIKAIEKFLECI